MRRVSAGRWSRRPVAHRSDGAEVERQIFCKLQAVATVNGDVAAEAILRCMLVDRESEAAPSDATADDDVGVRDE